MDTIEKEMTEEVTELEKTESFAKENTNDPKIKLSENNDGGLKIRKLRFDLKDAREGVILSEIFGLPVSKRRK